MVINTENGNGNQTQILAKVVFNLHRNTPFTTYLDQKSLVAGMTQWLTENG